MPALARQKLDNAQGEKPGLGQGLNKANQFASGGTIDNRQSTIFNRITNRVVLDKG
jgi:hypothetical protein